MNYEDEMYEDCYADEYMEGYLRGHEHGFQDGYEDGYDEGFDDGYAEGCVEDISKCNGRAPMFDFSNFDELVKLLEDCLNDAPHGSAD